MGADIDHVHEEEPKWLGTAENQTSASNPSKLGIIVSNLNTEAHIEDPFEISENDSGPDNDVGRMHAPFIPVFLHIQFTLIQTFSVIFF